jgi:hypothetical protein
MTAGDFFIHCCSLRIGIVGKQRVRYCASQVITVATTV